MGAERRRGAVHAAARAHADRDGAQHHEPARHRGDGLEAGRRAAERAGGGAARGPVRHYPRMTFATRDRYRHVVERIAKRTGRSEGARWRARPSSWRAPRGGRLDAGTSGARRLLPGRRWGCRNAGAAPATGPAGWEAVHRWMAAPSQPGAGRRHRGGHGGALARRRAVAGRPRGGRPGPRGAGRARARRRHRGQRREPARHRVPAAARPAQARLHGRSGIPPSTAPRWSCPRCSAASRRCRRRSRTWRCSSWRTARPTSTSPS
jgi:hypothetical protein